MKSRNYRARNYRQYYRTNEPNKYKSKYKEERSFDYIRRTEDNNYITIIPTTISLTMIGIGLYKQLNKSRDSFRFNKDQLGIVTKDKIEEKLKTNISYIIDKYATLGSKVFNDRQSEYFKYHKKFAEFTVAHHQKIIPTIGPNERDIFNKRYKDIITECAFIDDLLNSSIVKEKLEQDEISRYKKLINKALYNALNKFSAITYNNQIEDLDNIIYEIGLKAEIPRDTLISIARKSINSYYSLPNDMFFAFHPFAQDSISKLKNPDFYKLFKYSSIANIKNIDSNILRNIGYVNKRDAIAFMKKIIENKNFINQYNREAAYYNIYNLSKYNTSSAYNLIESFINKLGEDGIKLNPNHIKTIYDYLIVDTTTSNVYNIRTGTFKLSPLYKTIHEIKKIQIKDYSDKQTALNAKRALRDVLYNILDDIKEKNSISRSNNIAFDKKIKISKLPTILKELDKKYNINLPDIESDVMNAFELKDPLANDPARKKMILKSLSTMKKISLGQLMESIEQSTYSDNQKTLIEEYIDRVIAANADNKEFQKELEYRLRRIPNVRNMAKLAAESMVIGEYVQSSRFKDIYTMALKNNGRSMLFKPLLDTSAVFPVPKAPELIRKEPSVVYSINLFKQSMIGRLVKNKLSNDELDLISRNIDAIYKKTSKTTFYGEFKDIIDTMYQKTKTDLVADFRKYIEDNPNATQEDIKKAIISIGSRYITGISIYQIDDNKLSQNVLLTNILGEKVLKVPILYNINNIRKFKPIEADIMHMGNFPYYRIASSIDGNNFYVSDIKTTTQKILQQIVDDFNINPYESLQLADYIKYDTKPVYSSFDVLKAQSEYQNKLIQTIGAPKKITNREKRFFAKLGNTFQKWVDLNDDRNVKKVYIFDTETFGFASSIRKLKEKAPLDWTQKGDPATWVGHAYSIAINGFKIGKQPELLDTSDNILSKLKRNAFVLVKKQNSVEKINIKSQIYIREPIKYLYDEFINVSKNKNSLEYKNFMSKIKEIIKIQPTEYMRTEEGFIDWLTQINNNLEESTVKFKDVQKLFKKIHDDPNSFSAAFNAEFDLKRLNLENSNKSIDLMYLYKVFFSLNDPLFSVRSRDLRYYGRMVGVDINNPDFHKILLAQGFDRNEINALINGEITPDHFGSYDTALTAFIFNKKYIPTVSEYNNTIKKFGKFLAGFKDNPYAFDSSAILSLMMRGKIQSAISQMSVPDILNDVLILGSAESMAKGNFLKSKPKQSLMSFFMEFSNPAKQLYQSYNYEHFYLDTISKKYTRINQLSSIFENPILHELDTILGRESGIGERMLRQKELSNYLVQSQSPNFSRYMMLPSTVIFKGNESIQESMINMANGSIYITNPDILKIEMISRYTNRLSDINRATANAIIKYGGSLGFGETESELKEAYENLVAVLKSDLPSKEKSLEIGKFTELLRSTRLKSNVSIIQKGVRYDDGYRYDKTTKTIIEGKTKGPISRPVFTVKAGSIITSIDFDTDGNVRNIEYIPSSGKEPKTLKVYSLGVKGVITPIDAAQPELTKLLDINSYEFPELIQSAEAIRKKGRTGEIIEGFVITSLYGSPVNQIDDVNRDIINTKLNLRINAAISKLENRQKLNRAVSKITRNQKLDVEDLFKFRLKYQLGLLNTDDVVAYSMKHGLGEKRIKNEDIIETIEKAIHNEVMGVKRADKDAIYLSQEYRRVVYNAITDGYIANGLVYTREELMNMTASEIDSLAESFSAIFGTSDINLSTSRVIINAEDIKKEPTLAGKVDKLIGFVGRDGVVPKLFEVKQGAVFAKMYSPMRILEDLSPLSGPIGGRLNEVFRLNINKDLRFIISSFERGGSKDPFKDASKYMLLYQKNRESALLYGILRKTKEPDNVAKTINRLIEENAFGNNSNLFVDLNNPEIRSQWLDNFAVIRRLQEITGEHIKESEMPGMVYYHGQLISIEDLKRLHLSHSEIEELSTDAIKLNTQALLLQKIPRNVDNPELLASRAKSILNANKQMLKFTFELDGQNLSIFSLSPHSLAEYKAKSKSGAYYDVEILNPEFPIFQRVIELVQKRDNDRGKMSKDELSSINNLIRNEYNKWNASIGSILKSKHSEAALVSELPLGFRGTATAVNMESVIGKDDLFSMVVNFSLLRKTLNTDDAKAVYRSWNLSDKEIHKKLNNKILFDIDTVDALTNKKMKFKSVEIMGNQYYALTEGNIKNVLSLSNRKALKVSSIYGSASQGSFPITAPPIPLDLYVAPDNTVLHNAQIGLTSYVRESIFKDFDSDQVYGLLMAMTPNSELRQALLNNSPTEFKKELHNTYKFKINNVKRLNEILNNNTKSIDLSSAEKRIAFLNAIAPASTNFIDTDKVMDDDYFNPLVKLAIPDITDGRSMLFIDENQSIQRMMFNLGPEKTVIPKLLVNQDLIDEAKSAIIGKRKIPQGYIASRLIASAIYSNELSAGELTEEELKALKRRLFGTAGVSYENIIKSVKGNEMNDFFSDIFNTSRDKEYRINMIKNVFGVAANNEKEANWIGTIFANELLKQKYNTDITTSFDETSSNIMSEIFNLKSTRISLDNIKSSNILNFVKGKYGTQTINGFFDGIENTIGNNISKYVKSRPGILLSGLIAGALLFSNPNQTSWYDSNLPGTTTGEDNETNIRWTINNPITYFQRDLSVQNTAFDNLSRYMQQRQKYYALSANVLKNQMYYVPIKNYKQKFLSI